MPYLSRGRTAVVPAYSPNSHHRHAAMLALAVAAWAVAAAAAAQTEPLRLADVVEMARQANPELRAVREHAAALRAVPAQVSSYDDPTLSWEGWDIPESLRVDAAENNIFRLAQKVPWPGKRTLAGTVAEREADVAQHEVRGAELDLITQVTRAYYDLWLTYQKRDIFTRDQALVERFTHIAEQKYGIGEATQADALRAQVELTHMVIEVNTATLAIDTAAAELNAFLSRWPEEPLGIPENPPPHPIEASLNTLTDVALEHRPELAAQRAAIAREQSSVELTEVNRRPDFEFSVGRFVNYGRSDGFGAMASVTVPFVFRGKYDAATSEARAKLASAEAELRHWQDRVRREVAQAYLRVRTAALQHDLAVATHIPQAEQALRVTETAYETGHVDFLSLIDSVRRIEAAHILHVEAGASLATAMADLERAVGGELPEPVAAGK